MGRTKKLQKYSPTVCIFCRKGRENELIYGIFIERSTISLHENCLFFAGGLKQNGRPMEGIMGFLLDDIKKEVARGNKLSCFFCKKKSATIGCCAPQCRRTFHFSCGVENGALNQFFGSYSSFCPDHKPKQEQLCFKVDEKCNICFQSICADQVSDCLYASCCNNGWFHRVCLQEYAANAGRHHVKCPLCKSEEFCDEMMKYGISVPDRDASWEQEPRAFEELLIQPECGSLLCQCIQGRSYAGRGEWKLMKCLYCGSLAVHIFCERLELTATSWLCSDCTGFNERKVTVDQSSEQDTVPDFEFSTDVGNFHAREIPLKDCCNNEIQAERFSSEYVDCGRVPYGLEKIETVASTSSKFECKSLSRRTTSLDKTLFNNSKLKQTKILTVCGKLSLVNNSEAQRCTSKLEPVKNCMKRKRIHNSMCCSKENKCLKEMLGLSCHYNTLKN